MINHSNSAHESERLRAEAEVARQELAQVRSQLEEALETRYDDRARREDAEARLVALSEEVDRLLAREAANAGQRRSLLRKAPPEPGQPTDDEAEDIALLVASDLFDGPWYLRRHPESVATGLTPALHYLRHGATEGWDPGPDFDDEAYRRGHPDVGETPALLHHLRHQPSLVHSAGRR